MPSPKILIATSRHDGANYEAVARHLKARGCDVVLFEPDSVADGTKTFDLHIAPSGKLTISYDGETFDPASFDAAWHRRPHYFGEHKDTLRWLSTKDEYGSLMKTISQLVPADRWLNTWAAMQKAGQKLPQLQQAAEHGFVIPPTTVSNQWQTIEDLDADTLAVKMAELPVLYPEGKRKTLPTTVLSRSKLPKQAAPYPGIWQPYYTKKKEWRVTIVGDKVFAAAIYTDASAQDDWRKHQDTPSVTFKAEIFPEKVADLCRSFLQKVDLRFGAFDFIEQADGSLIFLEVNPNGQFIWLEDKLGLPIAEAIADELVAIATKRQA